MNNVQRAFLEQLAARIPALFEAISRGNVKSEYIIGVRRLGKRQVRLKLVAEVVEPGQQSPLHTHSVLRPVDIGDPVATTTTADPLARPVDNDANGAVDIPPGDAPNKQPSRHERRGQLASKRRSPRKR